MTKKKLVSLFMAMVMSFSIVAQAALPAMAADENLGDNGEEIVEVMDNGGETTTEPENKETLQPMGVDPGGTFGNGFSWLLLGETLTIDGIGDMPNFDFMGYVGDSDLVQTTAPWFEYNEQIEYVVFTEGVTSVGEYAFAGYPNITTVGLHEGLKSIGQGAFMLYKGTELNLPSTLEYLGKDAFLFAINVETLHIPANLEDIGYGAFSHMDSLTAITADPNNSSYTAVDGVLYSKDGAELVVYPCGNGEKNVVVPEGVSVIGNGAFWGKHMMKSVSLPSTLTVIDSGAFQVCMGLTEITIPEGVTYIGSYAFNSCDGLTTVNLPSTIKTIEQSAFARCAQLTTVNYAGDNWSGIEIASGNDYLVNAYGAGSEGDEGDGAATSGQCGVNAYWSFNNGVMTISGTGNMSNYWDVATPWSHLAGQIDTLVVEEGITSLGDCTLFDVESATLPEGLVYIGADALCGFRGTSITLPSTVERIAESAFCDAHNLTSIHLPAKVETVDATSFCRNYSLTQITVDANNPYYKSVDGVLYTEDGKMLIVVPAGKSGTSYTVENGTEIINGNGLAYCKFENVVLPDTVTSIGSLAFRCCENLETVTIPAGITTIKSRAFMYCDNLTTVNFKGTEAQWENILANTKYDNNPLLLATTYLGDNSVYEYKNVPVTFHHHAGEITVGFYKYMPLSIGGVGGSTAPTGGGIERWFTDPQLTQEWNMNRDIITGPIHLYSNTYVDSTVGGTLAEGIEWSLLDGKLSITGTGAMPDNEHNSTAPWNDYRDDIVEIVVGEGITHIGNASFENLQSLEAVSLPSTLKTIGKYGFYNCRKLKTINLPEGLTSLDYQCFHQCASLEEVVIPASVTVIPEYAFYECNNIHIKLHSGITEIGNYAFWESYNGVIEFIGTEEQWDAITKGNSAIGSRVTIVFSAPKEGTLDNGMAWSLVDGTLTITGTGAMPDWTYGATKPWDNFANSILHIVVGEGITTVGSFAFFKIPAKDITLPEGLTAIKESAFIGFTGVEIALPSTLESLGANAFGGATSLTSVQLPAALTNMDSNAFDGCISLAEYTVAEGNTKYTAVDGILYENGGATLFRVPYNVDTVIIPESVTSLRSDAFTSTQVKTVLMKTTSLNSIAAMAFGKCTKLEEIHIPESVTSVEMYAFDQCTNLKTIYYGGWEEKWENISLAPGNDALRYANVITDCEDLHLITVQQPAQGGHVETTRNFFFNADVPAGIIAATEEGYKLKAIVVTDEEGTTKYTGKDYVVLESADGDVTVTAEITEIISASGVIGDTEWHVEGDTLIIISSTGYTPHFDNVEDQPWYPYADEIRHIDIREDVTELGKNLFAGLSNVEHINVPYTVTTIGERAFADMGAVNGLEYLNEDISVAAYAFSGTSVGEYYLPAGTMGIGPNAYNGFSAEKFYICDSVQVIFESAFANFTADAVIYNGTQEAWDNIYIAEGNEALDNVILLGEPTDGYFEDTGVFWHYDNAETLYICGEGAMPDFADASEQPWAYLSPLIRRIVVDAGITHIGEYAFADMDYVERVRIFDTVETIGANAFRDSAVKYLLMPDTVTYIGENAFNGTQVEYDTFFFTGPRDKFWDIDIEDGNDEISYPSHINAQPNADWVTVYFDTGCGIEIDPVITVTGYNISQSSVPNPARNGYVITGWYTTPRYNGGPYNWKTDFFYEDTTLFARWRKLTTTGDDMQEEAKMTGFKLYSMNWEEIGSTYTAYIAGEQGDVLFGTETEGFGDYNQFLTVKSSNTDIAEYNPMYNGYEYQIILKKAGTVTLTFTSIANPKLTKTVKLTVKKLADEIEITMPNTIDVYGEKISVLTVGQKFKPTVKWIGGEKWPNFEISGYNALDYDPATGYATATEEGNGDISVWAWVDGGPSLDAYAPAVVFAQKTPSIQLNESNIVLDCANMTPRYSDVYELNVTNISDQYCPVYSISWTNNDNIIVMDESYNEITSPYLGERVFVASRNNNKASTTITFKAIDGSGKSASAKVQTGVAVESIWLSDSKGVYESSIYISKGKTVKLLADVAPATATVKTLKWSVWADEDCTIPSDIVTVSGGKVTAKDIGIAYVLAQATDGSGKAERQKIFVTDTTAKVQIGDGTTTSRTVYAHDEGYAWINLPVRAFDANGATATVSQDMDITVTGTNAKYAYFAPAPEGPETPEGTYGFEFMRSGTYTIKATAKDGSGKSATFKVTVQQHLFGSDDGLTVTPPKGVTTVDIYGNTVWVVKAGTTITPTVTFNGGQKAFAPVAAAKNYTVEFAGASDLNYNDNYGDFSSWYSVNGKKVKFNNTGYYIFYVVPETACSECDTQAAMFNVKVIPANGVDELRGAEIKFSLSKGYHLFIDDTWFLASTGIKTKITPTINGLKLPSGVNVTWTAYAALTSEPVAISTSGELNLAGVEPGTPITVECTLTDKANPANTVTNYIRVDVVEKLTPADIQLVVPTTDGYTPINERTFSPSDDSIYAYVVTKGAVSEYDSYTFKSSNTKVLRIETHPDLYGFETILKIVGTGTSTITVTANDGSGVKQTFKVTVNKEEVSVKQINATATNITVSAYTEPSIGVKLTPTVAGQQVSYPMVKWTVSDPSMLALVDEYDNYVSERIAPVDTDRWTELKMAPMVTSGKVTITGTALDGSKKTVKITVNIVPKGDGVVLEDFYLTLPANTPDDGRNVPTITWGKSLRIKATTMPSTVKQKALVWTVYAVDEHGDLTPNPAGITVKDGKVTVAKASKTLTPYEGVIKVVASPAVIGDKFNPDEKEMYIYVKAPLSKMTITGADTLYPGAECQLTADMMFNASATVTDTDNYPILWSVNNTKLAEIDENGVLTIKEDAKVGSTVKVTAATQDGSGKKATVSIKIVKKPAVEISVDWMPQELVDLTTDAVEGECIPITDDCFYYVHHDYDVQNIVFTANRDVPGFKLFEMGYDSYENYLYEEWAFCEDFPLTNKISLAVRTYLGETVPLIGYSYIDEATDERVYFYMNIHGNTGEITPRQFVPGEEWL